MSDSAGPRTRGELSEAWLRHLGLQRGLSEHTVRAYTGDLEDLLGFLGVDPDESAPVGPVLRGLTLADLRAWLAALAASGLIPARAGKTWERTCGPGRARAHPRACGENCSGTST